MDLTLTLKGKHEGEPIDIEIIEISVLIERQTWDYPGSADIDYAGIYIVDDKDLSERIELNEELAELYRDFIDKEIIEAWQDQDPY